MGGHSKENKKEVAEFYDDYIDFQKAKAINERHLVLVEKLKDMGMSTKSHILEFGSGIGTVTSLIAEVVKQGKIYASDISSKSIDFAKTHVQGKNIFFSVQDLTSFDIIEDVKFDYVTLFDVLEHVPIDMHQTFFDRLAKQVSDHTQILINIPHPAALEYEIEHHPEALQIIDQPLEADELIHKAYRAGFALDFFTTHSIWRKGDYQMMVFRKKYEFKNVAVNPQTLMLRWKRIKTRLGLS